MVIDNRICDMKSKPGSLARRLGGEERFEDSLLDFNRKAIL